MMDHRESGGWPTANETAPPPKVSVVVPTLRGGSYLREAVRSVLAQSFSDFELIIVADGCDDDLEDVAEADERVRVIRQPNRGESVARNVGIRAARAELIAFVDDDDRMLPDRISMQYDVMAMHTDIGICHTQFRMIDEHGMAVGIGYARDVQYIELLGGDLGIILPTTMMRKSIVQEVGTFDASLLTCQDVDVILRVARQSLVRFLPQVLTEYRLHPGNASRDTRVAGEMLEGVLAKHGLLALRSHDLTRVSAARAGIVCVRRLASGGHILQARSAWRQGERRSACSSLVTAFWLSPSVTLQDLLRNRSFRTAFLSRHRLGVQR